MMTSNLLGINASDGGAIEFDLRSNSTKQSFKLNGENYSLVHGGLFLNKTTITNKNNEIVLEAKPRNWWSSSYTVQFRNNEYLLKLENKPLATYSITQGTRNILSLSLVQNNKKLASKFEGEEANQPSELHALLWYLMHPVLQENDALVVLLAS